MFVEPSIGSKKHHHDRAGWIELICGCMFSGKTEELIRRLNRVRIAKQKVEIFKPAIDVRYHEENVVSHNENSILSTPIQFPEDIYLLAGGSEVIGIDEAQFFDESLVDVCTRLANKGKRVIVAGLDMDYTGKPFGPMPILASIAEYVTKVHAICTVCGGLASFTFRKDDSTEQVLLGETEKYEARCRTCFLEGIKTKQENNKSR